MAQKNCPSCGAVVHEHAAVCRKCNTNLVTGKQLEALPPPVARAGVARPAGSLPPRVGGGIGLLAVTVPALFWFFFNDPGDHDAARYTFLVLGLLAGPAGVFLLAGGRLAEVAYAAIGLGRDPLAEATRERRLTSLDRNTRFLVAALTFSAVWHLTIGSFVYAWAFETAFEKPGPEDVRAVVAILLYGVFPLVMAAYCRRKARWAYATVLVVYAAVGVLILVANRTILFGHVPRGATRQLNETGLTYLVALGIVTLIAACCLVGSLRQARRPGTP